MKDEYLTITGDNDVGLLNCVPSFDATGTRVPAVGICNTWWDTWLGCARFS